MADDSLEIIVIGTKETPGLRKELEKHISNGHITYLCKDTDSKMVKDLLGDTDNVPFPVAVVSKKGEDGVVGVISAIGESIIVHCPEQIVSLKGPPISSVKRVEEKHERFTY
jgi:hypothetical protein